MELVQEFHRLFAYDAWANREVLTSIRKCPKPAPHFLDRMGHILSAERLWLERLLQQEQTVPVWPKFSIEQCELEMEGIARRWTGYIAVMNPERLEELVSYRNSKGEPWSSRVTDILMHVVMHSAYHRGQIASDMRVAGCTPAYTDFIHCVRQELIE